MSIAMIAGLPKYFAIEYIHFFYKKMSTQYITKPKCQTCGRKIPMSGTRLSTIEFRRYVNNIDTLDKLFGSKEYLARFVKNKFRLEECVDRFLDELEEWIELVDPTDVTTLKNDINNIRIWILNYSDTSSESPESRNYLLGTCLETPLYDFLRSNYPDINETFHEFYENYAQNVDNPLNRNHASRALSALGLKAVMKKIKYEGKSKCVMVLCATKEELSNIFRNNFGF